DERGHGALRLWQDEGIDTSCIATRPDRPTGVAIIIVDGTGENRIIVDAGANLSLTTDDIDRAADLIAAADVVVAQLEVPVPAVHRAFGIARRSGVATLLNAAPAPAAPIDDLLELTDILVVNEVEAAALTGTTGRFGSDIGRTMAAALPPPTVVITAGAAGAYLYDGREVVHERPPAVGTIRDTTGAGDAFIGAFTAKWVETRDPVAALRHGTAAGSLACTAPGALPSFPSLEQICWALGP